MENKTPAYVQSYTMFPADKVVAECKNTHNWLEALRRYSVKEKWDEYQKSIVKEHNEKIKNRWFASWRKKIHPQSVTPFSEEIYQRILKEHADGDYSLYYSSWEEWRFSLDFHDRTEWYKDIQEVVEHIYRLAASALKIHNSAPPQISITAADWNCCYSKPFSECPYKDLVPKSELL